MAADGEVISGRGEIEKRLAEYFEANPMATTTVEVVSVRLIGRGTATIAVSSPKRALAARGIAK